MTQMIKDATGRKWFMRFKEYRDGWRWTAQTIGGCIESGFRPFRSRAAAENNARRYFQSRDPIAAMNEMTSRLLKRGTFCGLTSKDQEAIERKGKVISRKGSK
jgi:hypothetical protein